MKKKKSILILSPFSWWRAIRVLLHHPRCKEENKKEKHNNKVTTYRWEEVTAMNVLWESDSTSALGFMTIRGRQSHKMDLSPHEMWHFMLLHGINYCVEFFSSSVLAETLSFLLNEETRTTKVHANNGWNDDVDDDNECSSCPPGTTANQHQVR